MMPKEMGSLDLVEMVIAFEESFDVEIPDNGIARADIRAEVLDLLDRALYNQRPNNAAKALLRKLANEQQRPELAEGLEGTWRREQIAAIVREILR
jgi:hypothetical protein